LIAYGCAIGHRGRYERFARPGIALAAGAGHETYEVEGGECLFQAYNGILDQVAFSGRELDALVLVHEDTRICDPRFEDKLRATFAGGGVAVAGAFGAVGVTGIDWWVHERMVGSATLNSAEPFAPTGYPLVGWETTVGPGGQGEVDALDGMLLALSPWALANLRLDEDLGPGFHGYDIDLCFQARERGRTVIAMDISVEHHQRQLLAGEQREAWKRAHVAFRRKWEPRWPLAPPQRGTHRTMGARDIVTPLSG
jgi:hypothetical protein